MSVAIAVVATFVVSLVLTRRICDPQSWLHVLDHPNERSLHVHPVPRTGGVAILAGVTIGMLLLCLQESCGNILPWLGLSMLIIAILSYMDDHRRLSVRIRLLGHFICAAIVLSGGLVPLTLELPGMIWGWPLWFGIGVSMLFLIWMINLYNFMDGMDGLAAGMAVIGFSTFALFGILSGHKTFSAINLIIAAASAGFLRFNFPPARIFMGDTGSATLGLFAGGLSLWGICEGVFPVWAALLVFSPFSVDTTVTLLQRMARGERVWQAHKAHYYQHLIQVGWGHRKTVLWEYGLMIACAISALWAVRQIIITQWLILSIWIVVYSLLMLWIPRLEEKNRKQ